MRLRLSSRNWEEYRPPRSTGRYSLQLLFNSLAYNQAVLFCMISALAAAMDGFQTKIPGSISANRGFINQFGEYPPLFINVILITGTVTDKSGLLQLDAQHIAAWGGIFQGGVICGNLYGGL